MSIAERTVHWSVLAISRGQEWNDFYDG